MYANDFACLTIDYDLIFYVMTFMLARTASLLFSGSAQFCTALRLDSKTNNGHIQYAELAFPSTFFTHLVICAFKNGEYCIKRGLMYSNMLWYLFWNKLAIRFLMPILIYSTDFSLFASFRTGLLYLEKKLGKQRRSHTSGNIPHIHNHASRALYFLVYFIEDMSNRE